MRALSGLHAFRGIFFGTAVLLSQLVIAQEAAPPSATLKGPPTPCNDGGEFSQFDFWLGSWEVRDVTGNRLYGTNRIEKVANGCALLEHWRGRDDTSGISLNYYDTSTNEWVQVWSGSGGSQINIRGGRQGKSMRLDGTIHYIETGESSRFRGTWSPLKDGRVQQFFEKSTDDGKTWTKWFQGFYTRIGK